MKARVAELEVSWSPESAVRDRMLWKWQRSGQASKRTKGE